MKKRKAKNNKKKIKDMKNKIDLRKNNKEKDLNEILDLEFEKDKELKLKNKKRLEKAKIKRDKYAQLNVKLTKRVRELNDEKIINEIFGIENEFGNQKIKNTKGGWKEGTKINTTRSKWEKIKEPEENKILQLRNKAKEKIKPLEEERVLILVDRNIKKAEMFEGKIKYIPKEKIKLFKIQKKHMPGIIKVWITDFTGKDLEKDFEIEIKNRKVKVEELLKICLTKGIPIYEIM